VTLKGSEYFLVMTIRQLILVLFSEEKSPKLSAQNKQYTYVVKNGRKLPVNHGSSA
jgi:hypothetical protein